MQIVESHSKEGISRHRVVLNLGRCEDRATAESVRRLVRDDRPLGRAPVVIAELEKVSGRV